MKKLMVVLIVASFFISLSASEGKMFSKAEIKKSGAVTTMVTNLNISVKADEVSLKKFIKESFYKNFGIGQNIDPKLFRAVEIDGTSIFKFALFYKGIPVEGEYTVVTVRNGKIDRINNSLGNINLDVSKLISPELAVKSAMKVRNIKKMPAKYHAEKLIVKHFGKYRAAYKVRFPAIHLADSRFHVVDAVSGKVLKSGNSTYFADADSEAPDEEIIDVDPKDATDMARIWEFNPVVSELKDVILPWVAPYDDSNLDKDQLGFLTAEEDGEDVRKIKAFNCPNNGDTINLQELIGFPIELSMCTPKQLANKLENGSFIYDDCEDGHEFSEDKMDEENIDRCAEISMYYHASKIYDYLRGLYKDIDSKGEFYLQNNDPERPLNVIGNFQMPDLEGIMSGSKKLVPMDNAFFSQDNPMIGDLLGQFGIKGDLLVFGQGTKGDFAYDGDVVYHEFGHATIYTTGIEGMEFTDKYGISNEPGSIHEGLADTFAFLITDNTCTGEYASEAIVKWAASQGGIVEMDSEGTGDSKVYCMRTALNKYSVFEDFIGEVHWDGQPLLAANWEIYQLIKGNDEESQTHRDNLTKLILKTLYSIADSDASFKLWAETFMDEVGKDSNFKSKKAEIEKILNDRNFFEEIRARSANETVSKTYVGGGGSGSDSPLGDMGGSSGIPIYEDGKEINVGPSYLQFYFDVPEDMKKNGFTIKASVTADSGGSLFGFGGGGTPLVEVYYRKGEPVEYVTGEESLKTEALKDGKVEAEGTGSSKSWSIGGVEKGTRYYFQFVNTSAAGLVSNIEVTAADVKVEEDTDDDEVTDDAPSMGDDTLPDDKDGDKKKKSSGCSLTF
ncbi:MAG: hypothetical protein ACOX2F_07940 [bacterium]